MATAQPPWTPKRREHPRLVRIGMRIYYVLATLNWTEHTSDDYRLAPSPDWKEQSLARRGRVVITKNQSRNILARPIV
jgi:hypothetical protein